MAAVKYKYKAKRWGESTYISKEEILKETPEYVVTKNRGRVKKITDDSVYVDTLEEARKYLIDCEIRDIEEAKARIEIGIKRIEKIKTMGED